MIVKKIRDFLKIASEKALSPVIIVLNKTGITPNFITWTGFFINAAGAFFIFSGEFLTGGFIILFGSLFDLLDGALARQMNKKTKFGGFLDSVTDRLSEGVLYLALLVYYADSGNITGTILCYTVMFSSFLVSYIRARAGGLKIDCAAGIFTRFERMTVIIAGLVLNYVIIALWIIAVLSIITVIQRFMLVNEQAKS
ncbi:MAG: CDP-alcohol phosphatidyltransferase family protein [Candidatus Goldiibacteriota bacterium]